MRVLVVLAALLVASAVGQRLQSNSVRITKMPGVSGAFDNIKFYYDAGAQKLRWDYNLGPPGKPIEIFDFQEQVRYLGCGTTIKCNAESYKAPMPIFHKLSSDTSNLASASWATCGTTAYQRSVTRDTDVYQIAFDSNNRVCKAILKNGQTYEFTSVSSPSSFASGTFGVGSWNCPQKQCNKQLDIMLVLDVSGSVGDDWDKEKNFATNFAKSFTIGANAVRIGLVTFDDSAKVEFGLLNNRQSILNGIKNAVLRRGWTCIGCGLRKGKEILNEQGRNKVQKVIVLLSDGENNRPTGNYKTHLNNAITFAKQGTPEPFIVTIGVTSYVQAAEMKAIASGTNGKTSSGIQTYFPTANFNTLPSILSGLVDATCLDLPTSPCGTTCKGFCSCDQTCVCPDDCSTTNKCQVGKCSNGVSGSGCTWSAKNCNDNNACTDDSCVSSIGCINDPITCSSRNCTSVKCDTRAGCVYTATPCPGDGDSCKSWSCSVKENKCVSAPKACNACNELGLSQASCSQGKSKCEYWDCVQDTASTASCQMTGTVDCDDSNKCTLDGCHATNGTCYTTGYLACDDSNACTHNECDPVDGCVYRPFNVSVDCNDNNACTIDTCDEIKGCLHEAIVCDDGDPCTTDSCDIGLGCLSEPTDCSQLPELSQLIGDCYLAMCNDGNNTLPDGAVRPNELGCFLYQIPGTKVSSCGVCNGRDIDCTLGIPLEAAAGIAAGTLAAIVVGSAVAFLVVTGIAGKKGYDAYMRHKRDIGGAQNNALYQDRGLAGTNPFYNN